MWRVFCATQSLHERLVVFLCKNGRLRKNVIVPHGKQGPLLLPPVLLSSFLRPFFFIWSLLSHLHKHQFRSPRKHIEEFHIIALQCFIFIILFAVFLSLNGSILCNTSGGVQSESHGRVQTSSGAMVGPASANESAPYEFLWLPKMTRELTMSFVTSD